MVDYFVRICHVFLSFANTGLRLAIIAIQFTILFKVIFLEYIKKPCTDVYQGLFGIFLIVFKKIPFFIKPHKR